MLSSLVDFFNIHQNGRFGGSIHVYGRFGGYEGGGSVRSLRPEGGGGGLSLNACKQCWLELVEGRHPLGSASARIISKYRCALELF